MLFRYFDSNQRLICCSSNRRENVSMGHFKEIKSACINISSIPKQSAYFRICSFFIWGLGVGGEPSFRVNSLVRYVRSGPERTSFSGSTVLMKAIQESVLDLATIPRPNNHVSNYVQKCGPFPLSAMDGGGKTRAGSMWCACHGPTQGGGLSQWRAPKEFKIPLEGAQLAKKEYLWEGSKLQNKYCFWELLQATNDLNKNLNKGKYKYETKVPK